MLILYTCILDEYTHWVLRYQDKRLQLVKVFICLSGFFTFWHWLWNNTIKLLNNRLLLFRSLAADEICSSLTVAFYLVMNSIGNCTQDVACLSRARPTLLGTLKLSCYGSPLLQLEIEVTCDNTCCIIHEALIISSNVKRGSFLSTKDNNPLPSPMLLGI